MLELNDGVQTLLARYVGTDLYVDGKLDVLRLCEDLKIKVINYEFSDQRISGAIVHTPNEWLIYLNDKDSRRRKRFTVAHEIGHYISFEAGSYSKPFLENGQLITDMGILWRDRKSVV